MFPCVNSVQVNLCKPEYKGKITNGISYLHVWNGGELPETCTRIVCSRLQWQELFLLLLTGISWINVSKKNNPKPAHNSHARACLHILVCFAKVFLQNIPKINRNALAELKTLGRLHAKELSTSTFPSLLLQKQLSKRDQNEIFSRQHRAFFWHFQCVGNCLLPSQSGTDINTYKCMLAAVFPFPSAHRSPQVCGRCDGSSGASWAPLSHKGWERCGALQEE